jgi:hypothetical protein
MNNYEPWYTYITDLEETVNENISKEQKSQEQQLALWKERPRLAKEEIPIKVFQTLQKQHSIRENEAVSSTQDLNWPPYLAPPGCPPAAWEFAIISALVLHLIDEEKKE